MRGLTCQTAAVRHDLFVRALLLLTLAAGCGVADFDVEQDLPEQHVAGSPLGGLLGPLFELPIQLDLRSEIQAQETGPVDSVKLTSLILDITATDEPAPDTDDWAFIDRVDLYVESTLQGSTLPRVRVASGVAPGAVRTFPLVPEDVNLVDYVDEGVALTAEAEGSAPPDDVSFAGHAVFRVSPL